MCFQGEPICGCAGDEERGDSPDIAHAGDLDGEVGMGLGGYAGLEGQMVSHAVFTLGDFEVVVHQVADGVEPDMHPNPWCKLELSIRNVA